MFAIQSNFWGLKYESRVTLYNEFIFFRKCVNKFIF